jgi:hypothetical protein
MFIFDFMHYFCFIICLIIVLFGFMLFSISTLHLFQAPSAAGRYFFAGEGLATMMDVLICIKQKK